MRQNMQRGQHEVVTSESSPGQLDSGKVNFADHGPAFTFTAECKPQVFAVKPSLPAKQKMINKSPRLYGQRDVLIECRWLATCLALGKRTMGVHGLHPLKEDPCCCTVQRGSWKCTTSQLPKGPWNNRGTCTKIGPNQGNQKVKRSALGK